MVAVAGGAHGAEGRPEGAHSEPPEAGQGVGGFQGAEGLAAFCGTPAQGGNWESGSQGGARDGAGLSRGGRAREQEQAVASIR